LRSSRIILSLITMTDITLYQYEMCPYCIHVRNYFDGRSITYEKVNVSTDRSDKLRVEIAEKSGVNSVPVVKVDDKYIGDSANIIRWFKEHYHE